MSLLPSTKPVEEGTGTGSFLCALNVDGTGATCESVPLLC